MISRETFEEKFLEMAALTKGRRTLTARELKHWYRRIEELDNQVFESTVEWLIRIGTFPELTGFFEVYRREAVKYGLRDSSKCEWCRNGFVYFYKQNKEPDFWGKAFDIEWAIRCALCNQSKYDKGYDAQTNYSKLRLIDFDAIPDNDPAPPVQTVKEMTKAVAKPMPKPNSQDRQDRITALQEELEKQAKEMVDDETVNIKSEDFPYF